MISVEQTLRFSSWLSALRDRRAVVQIANRIDRLALGNPGDTQPVGEGVVELRIHTGPGYRVYFIRRDEALILLLCGGDKGSQKRDIETAKAMAKEIDR